LQSGEEHVRGALSITPLAIPYKREDTLLIIVKIQIIAENDLWPVM
jgi:hypothetical protein